MPVKKLKVESSKLKVKNVRKASARKNLSASRKLSSSVVVSRSQIPLRRTKKVLNKKTATTATQKKKRTQKLIANVYNTQGKVVSEINLPKEVFGAKVNSSLMAQAVRVYLANQRMGTASTKNRGEITGSTKKIWRQKGTGRARHGSRKAPIFVGGGVAFGPRPRDYSLKMPKKMKKAALFSALSYKQDSGGIKVVTGLEKILPKTKFMAQVVKKLGFNSKKINILLVTPDKEKNGFENVYRAGRNLEGLKILNVNTLNTYEVLDNQSIFFMKDAVGAVEKHFIKGGIV